MNALSELVIVGGVFLTVVLLCVVIIVSTVGTQATASRQMNKRIQRHLDRQEPGTMSLLRERYLDRLSPVERAVEGSTLVSMLSRQVEQSGVRTSALKIILQCLVFSAICAALAVMWFDILIVTVLAVAVGAVVPIVQLRRQGQRRRLKFEGQLSEALDMMARALRTGQPFHETLNLVSEEMEQPISDEFSRVSSDLNFGLPPKVALEGMLGRVPSTSLHTVVTAVLIQKETGGRLAEVLEKVSVVIRSRQSLKRKLNTLSADGRMSAWVLGLMPLALALLMSMASPGYLNTLIEDPVGQKLVGVACALMLTGVIWIRKIVLVEL